MPPEVEWFKNIGTLQTARAYKRDVVSTEQARELLAAPNARTLKGKRDKAILATLLYHGLRREELCRLRVKDMQMDEGVLFFIVQGKGEAERRIPINPKTLRLIDAYLKKADHGHDSAGPLFRPMDKNGKDSLNKHINTNSIYKHVIRKYGAETGINADVNGFCVHSLRATAATNALSHDADIAKVQEWLGHKDISTTRIYDRRDIAPEGSPTFKVKY